MKNTLPLIIVVVLIAAAGAWWLFGTRLGVLITTFEECVAKGNPVMESYPRQCRDGERTFTENIGNELEKIDLIRISTPRPNQTISSPLTIRGEARGTWFFEASFPVVLTDWDGRIIAEGIAQAKNDWMTTDFVPFEATLTFTVDKNAYSNKGSLILRKDNPSGLPQNDDALEIPIVIAGIIGTVKPPPTACTQEAKLCSDGTAVGRTGPNCEFAACPSTPPLTCTPNAPQTQTLSCPTGQTGTIIQTRTSSCPGPTWSGWTTTTNTCTTPPPPASCTFNGQTIPSGTSVTAYQSATATQCVSEQRTCNNGTLSGSYTNSSCTVSGGTNATFSASPGSGNAPLGVTFSVTGLIGTTQMGINFRDGTTGSLTGTGTLTVTHTYSTAGTYSVAIYGGVAPGTLFNTTTLTVTVSGGGGTTSAVTCETNVANVPSGFGSYGYPMAAPMSGSAPLTVRFWVFVNMAGTVGGVYEGNFVG